MPCRGCLCKKWVTWHCPAVYLSEKLCCWAVVQCSAPCWKLRTDWTLSRATPLDRKWTVREWGGQNWVKFLTFTILLAGVCLVERGIEMQMWNTYSFTQLSRKSSRQFGEAVSEQTWYLSKKLRDRSFGSKIFTRKTLIATLANMRQKSFKMA